MILLMVAALLSQEPDVEKLIEKLGSDRVDERAQAREQLKKLGEAVIPALDRVAKGSDRGLADEAIDLLTAIRFMGNNPRKLIEQLRSSDPSECEFARRALRNAGKAAEPHLIKALADTDSQTKQACLKLLVHLRATASLEQACKVFDLDQDPAVREGAFRLLKSLGQVSEDAFIARLKGPRVSARVNAIDGLREIKSEKALKPVAEIFLNDLDSDIRAAAALLLGSQGLKSEEALLQGLTSRITPIRLASIQVLGEIESQRAYVQVSRIYQTEKNWDVHRSCFEFFKRFGLAAEKDLLLVTNDENLELRGLAALALSDVGSKQAIPRLIDLLSDSDRSIKESSEIALASIGSEAMEQVRKAVESGRLSKVLGQALEDGSTSCEVERLLERMLGPDDSTNVVEGQFKGLESFGRAKVIPVLVRILNDQSYKFYRGHRHDGRYKVAIKELAIMALGVLGGDAALPALRTFSADNDQTGYFRLLNEALLARHRLGEEKPIEDRLRDLRKNADKLLQGTTPGEKANGCDHLFTAGLLLTRLNRREEAVQVYQGLSKTLEREPEIEGLSGNLHASVYYNLACLSTLAGDRANGLAQLEKSIRAGFTDRAWIRADHDLDAIRNEEGYKKLLEDDLLFEK